MASRSAVARPGCANRFRLQAVALSYAGPAAMPVARPVVAAVSATLVVAAGPKWPKALDDKAIIADRSVSCRDVPGATPAPPRLRGLPAFAVR